LKARLPKAATLRRLNSSISAWYNRLHRMRGPLFYGSFQGSSTNLKKAKMAAPGKCEGNWNGSVKESVLPGPQKFVIPMLAELGLKQIIELLNVEICP
jgi:hypothetical protein